MYRKITMILAAMALLAAIVSTGWASQGKDVDGVVATVNGIKISRQDFDRELRGAQQYFASQGSQEVDINEIKKAVIDKLVNSVILSENCRKKGVKVDKADIDAEYQGFRSRFPDEEQFHEALNQLSLTDAEIKEKIEQSLTVEKYVNQEFVDKAKVTEREAKDYYENNISSFQTPEQVRASHILILAKEGTDDATKKKARKKLERIRKQIVAGGDFATFAKKNSECPSSSKGGDLGFFSRGQMVKPFEKVAFSMMLGDVSEVVETQFGFHLIKVLDKKHAETISFKDSRNRIEQYLRQTKSQKALVDFLESERKTAKVIIDIPVD